MFTMLFWELRRRRTAIIWWTIGSVVITVVIMALYPSIRDQAKELNQVINSLPDGMKGLKAGGEASVDVADPISFLNSQLFYITLPILWIIQAITRGSSALGRDEQDHTLELLLARPISRLKLLLAKSGSIFVEFAIVGIVTLAAIVASAPLFDLHVGAWELTLATFYTLAFSLSFGLIAFALQAASMVTRRLASAIAVLISFGGYLIASLSGLTDWLEVPAKLAPFHYFAPDKIMQGSTPFGLNVYLIGTLVIAAIAAYIGFRRRDIN